MGTHCTSDIVSSDALLPCSYLYEKGCPFALGRIYICLFVIKIVTRTLVSNGVIDVRGVRERRDEEAGEKMSVWEKETSDEAYYAVRVVLIFLLERSSSIVVVDSSSS